MSRRRLYIRRYPEHFSLFPAILSIQLFFLNLRFFLTPSWNTIKAADGLSMTFNMLFCPYFRSYSENFSLLWALSSIQLLISLNDGHFGRHLGFIGNSKAILQDT